MAAVSSLATQAKLPHVRLTNYTSNELPINVTARFTRRKSPFIIISLPRCVVVFFPAATITSHTDADPDLLLLPPPPKKTVLPIS